MIIQMAMTRVMMALVVRIGTLAVNVGKCKSLFD